MTVSSQRVPLAEGSEQLMFRIRNDSWRLNRRSIQGVWFLEVDLANFGAVWTRIHQMIEGMVIGEACVVEGETVGLEGELLKSVSVRVEGYFSQTRIKEWLFVLESMGVAGEVKYTEIPCRTGSRVKCTRRLVRAVLHGGPINEFTFFDDGRPPISKRWNF
jgi:hypothetical protein